MAVSYSEFWRLLLESRLLTPERRQRLGAQFEQACPGDAEDAQKLAEWLISQKIITPYQSKLLLAGRPGPFHYGEYLVFDRLDRGRLAGCFRALHLETRHPVLLQFLSGELLQNGGAWRSLVARAERECGVIHPALQRCFELVDLGDYKFLVLEDARGETLAERLTGGKLTVPQACGVVRQAALALAELHGKDLVHGDVRPKNLLLEDGPRVKLLRDLTSPPAPFPWGAADSTGDLLDRSNYLAPEMAQPGRPPDVLTDIYALGCTLYHALAGRPPFPGGDMLQKMRFHATARIHPLEEFGVPAPLGRIVAYMMAKNPQVRLSTAANAAEQLAALIEAASADGSAASPRRTLAAFEAHLAQKRAAAELPPKASPPTPTAPVANGEAAPAVNAAVPPAASVVPPVASVVASTSVVPPAVPAVPPVAGPVTPVRLVRRRKRTTTEKVGLALSGFLGALLLAFFGWNYFEGENAAAPHGQTAGGDSEDRLPEESLDEDGLGALLPRGAPVQPDGASQAPAALVQEIVPDDGELLWASPTSGPPIDLTLTPPGAQLFLVVRPADLLAAPYGADALKALGPRFETLTADWQAAAGVKLDEIEQLIVALHANQGRTPRASMVVRLQQPLDQGALLSRWGNPPPQSVGEAVVYAARGWSFFIPQDQRGVFLMGAQSEVEEAARQPHAAPLLRREMERLRRVSDSQRHVSALWAPNFLFFDAQELFAGDLKKLHGPLREFFGDGLNAALLSAHFDERLYLEVRLHGTLDRDKSKLASEMRDRLARTPDQIEDYVARLVPHPYWRKLALRFPPMIRFLHQQARVGAEEDHAVINAVLPAAAAPNLLAASELALASQPGAAYISDAVPAGPSVTNLEELLTQKFSLSFPQQSLDFAMQDVAREVRDAFPNLPFPFDIKIIGKDLELNGITQNQQIRDFEARDKPLQEILTALVMKANPIATVAAPNEADQKLIWVVGPAPADPSQEILLITTRDAAAQKGYTLPEAFR